MTHKERVSHRSGDARLLTGKVVPLRLERGLREPKTLVLTITPWNKLNVSSLDNGAKLQSFSLSAKYSAVFFA